MENKIFAITTFTLKQDSSLGELMKLIQEGIKTTSSENEGFYSSSVLTSADGKTVVNFSEWNGDINLLGQNHQKNEANPDYIKQIEKIKKIANFEPMAYFKAFEYKK